METLLKSDYVKLDSLYSGKEAVNNTISQLQGGHDYSYRDDAENNNNNKAKEDAPAFCCVRLTFKQRLIFFIVCVCLGFLLTIFSWVTVFRRDNTTFAVLFSFSSVILILSTFFLCGPLQQLKNMTKIHRLIPTLVFVVSIVLTFIMAFAAKVPGLTILFIFIQYFSLAWYCITYIPFAKEGILRCFGCRR